MTVYSNYLNNQYTKKTSGNSMDECCKLKQTNVGIKDRIGGFATDDGYGRGL